MYRRRYAVRKRPISLRAGEKHVAKIDRKMQFITISPYRCSLEKQPTWVGFLNPTSGATEVKPIYSGEGLPGNNLCRFVNTSAKMVFLYVKARRPRFRSVTSISWSRCQAAPVTSMSWSRCQAAPLHPSLACTEGGCPPVKQSARAGGCRWQESAWSSPVQSGTVGSSQQGAIWPYWQAQFARISVV